MTIYFRSSVQNFNKWWFWIRKTNTLLNLMKEQDDIDKIYLYAKNLCEPKNKFLSVQIQWMTFIRILMTAIQPEKEKC